MQTYEIETHLGPALDDFLTRCGTEGIDSLARAADLLAERYPGDGDDAEKAYAAAEMTALGDETVAAAMADWQAKRAAERDAMAHLTGTLVWRHVHDGATEADLVRETGLARNTVRKALGL